MIIKFIKKNIFLLLITIVSLVLLSTNYKPKTFLIGWDNLFPEFNFRQDFYKNLFSVWQQYRGLGLIDGMSHAANLVHDIERLFLWFFFPTSLVRWVYILTMHFCGGLGMYYLIKKLTKNNSIGFIGGLFYQFNLITIQQFFLPFEVFVVHFAFLPWLILLTIKYLEYGKKVDLVYFFVLSLISVPQAHVPTLFIVYIIALLIVSITKIFVSKNFDLKRFFFIILITFSVNAFWGLPFFYSTLTNSTIIVNSKTFQMSSNDIYYRNKKYNDLFNVLFLKGFSLDFKHINYKTNQREYMMWPWLNHIKTPFFIIPAWLFLFLALIGFFQSFKDKKFLPFTAIFLFSFSMMGTDIPGIKLITEFLRKNIPLFSTVFRFTFTKFSILYVFGYCIMIAIGLNKVINQINNLNLKKLILMFSFFLILSYTFPSFQGHFFYENLAVKIPDEYFQVFNFFQKQNHNERVAILPIPWYWAWLQPKWGTISSGFIWYGIPQPITDLAFTPWGKANENFYWELDQAIFSKNPLLIEKILNKYDIAWIYLDKNILNEPGKKMTYETYEELLSKVKGVSLSKKFKQIVIFHYQSKNNLKNFVEIKSNLPSIAPEYNFDNFDQAYLDYGDYLSDKKPQIYYPFRSLFSGKSPQDIEFKVKEDNNFIYFKAKLPDDVKNWKVKMESRFSEELSVIKNNYDIINYSPKLSINNDELIVKINKQKISVYQSTQDKQYLNQTNNACNTNKKGVALLEKQNNAFILTSIESYNCIKIELPNLYQRFGYLFNIKTISDDKRGLFFNIINETTNKIDLETYLHNDGKYHNDYFIFSPRGFYDKGYTIYFNNISEGREKVINSLNEVNIYQIPYYFLKGLKLINPINQVKTQNLETTVFEVEQKNISFYQIKVNSVKNNSVLYLSQSFNPGWIAFANGKLLKHVKVNNWANGWKIESDRCKVKNETCQITIIFWPQYLEFIGFGLLLITFLFILFYQPKVQIDKNIN